MDYEDDFFRSNPQQDDAPRPSLLDELRNSSDEEETTTGEGANFGHPQQQHNHHHHHHHRRKGDDAEPFENDDDDDEEDATSSDESDGYGDMGGVIQHQRVTSSHAAQFLYAQATAAARAAAASSSSSGGSGGAAASLAAALMMQQRSRPPQDDDDEDDSDEEEDEEYDEEDEEDNDAAAPSRAGPSHADLLAMLSQRLQQQQQQPAAAAAARGVSNEGSGASTHPAQDSSAAATVASDPRQIQSSLEADLAALLKQDDDLAQVAKEIHAAARANELNRSQQQQQQQQAPSRMQVGGPGGPPMGPPGMGRLRPPRSGAGGMYQPASFFAPNGGMPLPRGVGGGRYGGGGPPSHHLHHHHHQQHHSGVPPPAGWYDYEAAAGAAGGYPFPAEFLLAHGYATAEGGAAVPFGGEYPPGMLAAVGFGMPPHRMRSQAAGQPIRTNRGGEPPMPAVPPPLSGQGLPPMQSVFLPDPLTTPPPKPLRTTIRLQDLHRHLHLNERMLEDLQRLWRDCAESGNTKLMEAGLGTVLDLQRHVVELAKTSVREETEREMRDEVQKRMKELAKLAAAQAAAGSLDPNSAATPEKGGDATAAAAAANSTTAAAAAAGSFVPNVNAMPFTPPPSLSLTHTDMEPSLRPPPPAISYLAMLGGGSGHNNNNSNNNRGGGGSSHNHHPSQSSPLTPQQQQQLQHLHTSGSVGGSTSGSASRGHHQPSFQEVAAKHSTSIPNFHDAPSLPGASSAPSTSSSVAGGQQSHSANSYLAKLASKPSQNKNSPPQKGSGESHYPHYEGGDGGSDGGGGVSPHSMKPATSTSHQTSSSSSSVPPFLLANLPTLDTSYPHSHQQQNTSNTSPSHEESAAAGQSAALTYLALARSAASKSGPTLKKALTLSASESGGGISLAALEATIAQQKEAAHLMSIPVGRTKKDSAPQPPAAAPDIDPTTTPVAYVEFKRSRIGKFPSTKVIEPGNYVIVTGDRGLDCGLLVQMTAPTKGGVSVMTMEGSVIDEEQIKVEPNTEIIRLADDHEVEVMHETIPELERVALRSCRESCKALRLGIDVLDCEFQFDRKKVSFYYYSEDVIDFRDLVKVMYKTYGARIWMENVNLEVRNMSPPKERRKERKAARAAAAAARAVLLGRR